MLKKNISKILLVVSLISSSLMSTPIEITGINLSVPSHLEDVRLFHDECGFIVKDNDGAHAVQIYNVDKTIRNISNAQLDELLGKNKPEVIVLSNEEFANLDMTEVTELTETEKEVILSKIYGTGYISINRSNDGEYLLQVNHRILGAGIWGAIGGAWVGKFVASAVCHTVIFTIGGVASIFITPVGGGILIATLESTFGAVIETTTTAVALAAGIAGAVVTGPI